jgi:hypothetical protein
MTPISYKNARIIFPYYTDYWLPLKSVKNEFVNEKQFLQ